MIKHKIISKVISLGYKSVNALGLEVHCTNYVTNNLFDIVLSKALIRNKDDFVLVQLGANDGITNDPIHNFIRNNNLTGLLVEPLPDVHKKLVQNYNDKTDLRFANVAISQSEGKIPIFRITPWFTEEYRKLYKENANASGVSSTSYEHVESFLKRIAPSFFLDKNIEAYIETVNVDSMSLNSLFNHFNIERVNFLQIDCEGYDCEIIKMLLKTTKIRPEVINYEHKALKNEERSLCETLLMEEGYSIFKHGGDTCAFRSIQLN